MPSSRIQKLVIVGLGSIGRRHASIATHLISDVEILGVRFTGTEAPPGISRVTSTLQEALEFRPDAAVMANPAPLHVAMARQFVSAGIPVLIEKPISNSIREAVELVNEAENLKVPILVGYNLRFSESLLHFRSSVQSGAIGRILSVRSEVGQHLATWRPGTDYRQSVSALRELGGGALLELSHELDYIRWIFGEPKWVEGGLYRQSELELDVEDLVHVTFECTCPRSLRPVMVSATLDFIRQDTTRTCTAIGDQGTMRWNGIAGTVERFCDGNWQVEFSKKPERDDTYRREWQHFVRCVEGTEAPTPSGRDGVAVLNIVEAIRAASGSCARFVMGSASSLIR